MKKMNQKGFTLAELLIVVAIIAVLVAIAIPVFSSQLEKARESTDLANIRSTYAEIVLDALEDNEADSKDVDLKQQVNDWQSSDAQNTLEGIFGKDNVKNKPVAGKSATIEWVPADGNKEGHCTVTFVQS